MKMIQNHLLSQPHALTQMKCQCQRLRALVAQNMMEAAQRKGGKSTLKLHDQLSVW